MAHRTLVAFQLPPRDRRLLLKVARIHGITLSALIRRELEPLLDGERTVDQLHKALNGND